MKFNCGTKSFWIPLILPALLAVIGLPLFLRRAPEETTPQPKAPHAPIQIPPSSAPPPAPVFPGPPTSPDPVLRQFQTAIRTHDAKGVLNAQSVFLEREGEYREKLMAMAKEDSEPRIRAFTVAVLGRMKSPPSESYFLERLDDASEYPRVSALEALEKIGTAGCLTKVDALASSDPAETVRAAAARAAKAVRSR